jgi:hypothetical protein
MDKYLADQVRHFICDFWRVRPDKLRSYTRMEEDLGMTGLDAEEFLEAFAKAFDVDLTGIQFHKHFGPECPIFSSYPGLTEAIKDLGSYPVTVGHLIEVAGAHQWACPPRHGEKKWPELPPLGLWDRELDGC